MFLKKIASGLKKKNVLGLGPDLKRIKIKVLSYERACIGGSYPLDLSYGIELYEFLKDNW